MIAALAAADRTRTCPPKCWPRYRPNCRQWWFERVAKSGPVFGARHHHDRHLLLTQRIGPPPSARQRWRWAGPAVRRRILSISAAGDLRGTVLPAIAERDLTPLATRIEEELFQPLKMLFGARSRCRWGACCATSIREKLVDALKGLKEPDPVRPSSRDVEPRGGRRAWTRSSCADAWRGARSPGRPACHCPEIARGLAEAGETS